jgi:hypothetical protein
MALLGLDSTISPSELFGPLIRSHRHIIADALHRSHDLLAPALDTQRISRIVARDPDDLDWGALMRLYNICTFLRRYFVGS